MKYGICHLSMASCRLEASDKSEMVTQVLFGETFMVFEQQGSWCRITTSWDNYECWIDSKLFCFISKLEYEQIQKEQLMISMELVQVLHDKENSSVQTIVLGSNLPHYEDGYCRIDKHSWEFEGSFLENQKEPIKGDLVEHAYMYLNTPYLWGGRSPFGIDCSGFVQMVYKMSGLSLPRDASQQALIGSTLSFIEEAEEGDLAFFDNEEGNIIHVGIVLNNNRIIHASGKVRIDRIDHQGIFNVDTNRYSHNLRLMKKVF